MEFANRPDSTFFIFIGLYLLLYSVYLLRIYILSRETSSRFNPVVYKFVLRTTYFLLILIALLGPTFGVAKRNVPISEKNIFIALDLSASMKAEDVLPSRFTKAKLAILQMIESISNARIGIIIFSSEAFLQSPLTYDNDALRSYTNILIPGLIVSQGTDFSEPLKLALEKFQDVKDTRLASQHIILISDGQDFSSGLYDIIDQLNRESIKVFSLGVGTDEGDVLKIGNEEVNVVLNRSNLMKISNRTGGEYFELSDSKDEINKLSASINNQETEGVVVVKADSNSVKYIYFLLPALLLMLLDVFVTINVIRL